MIGARDAFSEHKYGDLRLIYEKDGGPSGVHMPSQSWMPLLASAGFLFIGFGMPMMSMGIPYAGWLVITGLVVLIAGIWLWALEGPGGYMLTTPTNTAPANQPSASLSR